MSFINKIPAKNLFRHHGVKLNDRRKEAVATLEKELKTLSLSPINSRRRDQIQKELDILKGRVK